MACEDLKPARRFVVNSGSERRPVSKDLEVIGVRELALMLVGLWSSFRYSTLETYDASVMNKRELRHARVQKKRTTAPAKPSRKSPGKPICVWASRFEPGWIQ